MKISDKRNIEYQDLIEKTAIQDKQLLKDEETAGRYEIT